jgi:hypothetical protein
MLIEVDSKRTLREPVMTKALRPAHYLGALSEDGEHLTLVSISPDDPWQAFKAMRKKLRRSSTPVALSLYDSKQPVEHTADIVVLRPRQAV